jgi:putative RNA 2'-phosphotransferase
MYCKDRFRHSPSHEPETAPKTEKPLPPYLYYGTGTDFRLPNDDSDIYPESGDAYVNLYERFLAALCLGLTKGKPVLYRVNSQKMAEDGYVFQHSEGIVWITEKVPAEYCELIKQKD